MKKLLLLTGGLLFVSCKIEMPTKPPDWYFTVNIPVGDTTFYAMDFKERARLDTIGGVLIVTKDTTVYNIPIGNINLPFIGLPISFEFPEDIDTAGSTISSYIATVKLGAELLGKIYDTTTIAVILKTPWAPEETSSVTFYPQYPADTTSVDTLVYLYNNSVPLGFYYQFHVGVGLSLRGRGLFDSVRVFYEIPFEFMMYGDTLCTKAKEIKVGKDIIEAVDQERIESIRLYTEIDNQTPIEAYLFSDFYSMDYQDTVRLLDGYILKYGPGSVIVELNKEFINLFTDSLIHYQTRIILPAQMPETTRVSPYDYIDIGGHISATIFTGF